MIGSRRLAPFVSLTLLWGALLGGSFVYLPALLEQLGFEQFGSLFSAITWLSFVAVVLGIGLNYSQISNSRNQLWALTPLVLSTVGLGLILLVEAAWISWFLFVISTAFQTSIITFRVSHADTGERLARTSAKLGIAPIAGSTLFSLLFGFTGFFFIFPISFGLILIGSSIQELRDSKDHQAQHFGSPGNLSWSPFFIYGLLISLAIALANTHLYARVSELIEGNVIESAESTGRIILLAGLAGVLGSSLLGLRWMRGVSRLVLLRAAAGLVALGACGAAISENIAIVGLFATLAGFGFGIANGLEITVLADIASDQSSRPLAVARYMAVTTAPYVIGGFLGTALTGLGNGAAGVFWLAGAAAALAGAFAVRGESKL